MKEPEGHGEYAAGYDGLLGRCAKDGKKWPCPTWRKWTASKDYRIKELETKVERLGLDAAGNRKELASLREAHRRLELLVRGGVLLALRDAGRCGISETVVRDIQEYTLAGSSEVARVAGTEDYTVTFTGKHSRYVNGRLEESWS